MERTYSFILLALVLIGSIVSYVVFATPFAFRIAGAKFGGTDVYVHVSFTNFAVVQGATVYFIGMSQTGQALTTTKTTDGNGDASAGIYSIMWDSTVEGNVRVVYAQSNYDKTVSVYGQSDSTTTLVVDDVPTPAFTLTITSSAGGSTNPSAGTYSYQGGSITYVTATPVSGYKFDYWLLDGVNAGTTNPIDITFDKSHTLSAVFSVSGQPPPSTYQLTITASTGGTTNPSVGTTLYSANQIATVTATPISGYRFDYWQIDGASTDSSNPISLTMEKSHTLKAVFSQVVVPSYELTVIVKDQVGNELQSTTVNFVGKSTKTTDSSGMAKESFISGSSVTVQASFTKEGRTFQASKTITVDGAKTETIMINRQFYWTFNITYTNGTKPNGVLTLQSATKNTTANVVNGEAEAWLDNKVYSVYFHASPQSKIGSIAPVNDGSASYTLTPPTDTSTSTTSTSSTTQSRTSTSEPAPFTSPLGEVKVSYLMLYLLVGISVALLVSLLAFAVYSLVRGED